VPLRAVPSVPCSTAAPPAATNFLFLPLEKAYTSIGVSFPKSSLILNDIFDVREFIKDIDYNIFIQENIEELDIPKSDLVVSSSVFQWIKDKDSLIRNIAENTDNLDDESFDTENLDLSSREFLEEAISDYNKKFGTIEQIK